MAQVERDLTRVLDLLVLKKDADGSLEVFELRSPQRSSLPIQALLAAIEADEKEEAAEDTEQLAATEGKT